LVEQRIENPRVLGSIPRLATSIYDGPQRWGPFSLPISCVIAVENAAVHHLISELLKAPTGMSGRSVRATSSKQS
jgi:hypothetical protein